MGNSIGNCRKPLLLFCGCSCIQLLIVHPRLQIFTISQAQSTLEFFLSGSMAKVLTLLTVVCILMIRPQGLFTLNIRR